MKFYITRNDYTYMFSMVHPKWVLLWGRWRWVPISAAGICVPAGNKLLRGLGLEPLTISKKDKRVLIQVKLNTRTKTWEATEWVMG